MLHAITGEVKEKPLTCVKAIENESTPSLEFWKGVVTVIFVATIMEPEPVFNPKRRTVRRTYISTAEVLWSIVVILSLAGIVVWTAAQRNAYDPGERDIPFEMLARSPVFDDLYKPPLKPWSEPGQKAAKEKVSLGLFPESVLDGGWRIGSPLKQFSPETLYEKINGEAEKFLREGFKSLHYIRLRSDTKGEEIAIELFDQGNQKGSMSIFSDYVSRGKEVKQIGQAFYFMTFVGAIGRKGRYFFRIAGDKESERIRLKSLQLVEALSRLPEDEARTSVGIRVLRDGMDIDPGRITYQGTNVFQFDFAGDFWFGQVEPEKPTRLFLHRAATPEEATRLFEQIVVEQGYDYEVKERSSNYASMRHSFLKTFFAIKQKGRFIYGIEKAPDDESLTRVMDSFERLLPSE